MSTPRIDHYEMVHKGKVIGVTGPATPGPGGVTTYPLPEGELAMGDYWLRPVLAADPCVDAEAIVRDLAAATTGPNDESPDLAIPLSDYALKCFFCGAVANVDVVPHEDSCLVRRAREWVSTHPQTP